MTIRVAGLVMIALGLVGLGTSFIDWQAIGAKQPDETAATGEPVVDETATTETTARETKADDTLVDGQENNDEPVDVAKVDATSSTPVETNSVDGQPPGNVKIFERDNQPEQAEPTLWASITAASEIIDEDSGHANFLVTLSEPADRSVVIIFSTIDLSASDQEDYRSQRGTVTFEPGVVSAEIKTPLVDDDIKEDDEQFAIILNGAPGIVQFKSRRITATIRDND